jgi:hypothetical protein
VRRETKGTTRSSFCDSGTLGTHWKEVGDGGAVQVAESTSGGGGGGGSGGWWLAPTL